MGRTPTKQQLKDFGLLIGIGLPLFVGWLLPALSGHGFRVWTLWIGFVALILGLFSPSTLHQPYKGWMAIGHALGYVNSHIILGIIFLLVLQPIALIMRAFGYDPLRKKKKNASTYREIREDSKTNLTRIF